MVGKVILLALKPVKRPGKPLALVVAVTSVPLAPKVKKALPLPLPLMVSVPIISAPFTVIPMVLLDFSLKPALKPEASKVTPESTITDPLMFEISPVPVQVPLEVNSMVPVTVVPLPTNPTDALAAV